ncbi:MAG TPA: ABC transporter substrate-binding protein [Alphaproteobacteria bacterium]|jgi:phospholipid transport system substrate-binding protein|nr:ABC transporter substrate-binding protein [Alphaproteobacteria bacterium]
MLLFRTLRAGAVALAALVLVAGAAHAQAPSAKDFVQKMGDSAIKQLTDKTLPDNERVKRMRQLLRDSFDEAAVSRFVLGPYWNRATPDQRTEFQKLYEVVVAHNYAGLFKKYSGQTFQVQSDRALDSNTAVVYAQINQTNGAPPIPVEMQVDRNDDKWRATDIKVDGVSMPQTHRKEYSSVMSRSGIDGLLSAMRAKAKELEAAEPSE